MKTFSYILTRYLAVAVTVASLSSCLADDMSDCVAPYSDVKISVKFEPGMYELPGEQHKIDSVHIFIFDENNKYVSSWRGGKYNYLSGEEYSASINLGHGTYQFITWTNVDDDYIINLIDAEFEPGFTSLDGLILYLKGSNDKIYVDDIPDLHYGICRNAYVGPLAENHHTIYLIPNTYKVNFTVKDLAVQDGDKFEFAIKENNSHFDFENSIIPDMDDFQHIRTCYFDQENLYASFKILPLTDGHSIEEGINASDRSPEIVFSNLTTGKKLYSNDLVKMIRDAYSANGKQVNFSKSYNFDIIMTFDSNMDILINVNGWIYRYTPTELS